MKMSLRAAATLFGLALLIASLPDLARDPRPDAAPRVPGTRAPGK